MSVWLDSRSRPTLTRLTQLYSDSNSDVALEFFNISQEILDEIELARKQKLLISRDCQRNELSDPAPQASQQKQQPAPQESCFTPKPPGEVYREYAPKPGTFDLERITEVKESPSTEARENRMFPFGQKPFEFHWDRRLEQHPAKKNYLDELKSKSFKKPDSSPPKGYSRARAMAYKPPEEAHPGSAWQGRPLHSERPSVSSSPRCDTVSPKKDMKRVKLSQPPPIHTQKKRPPSEAAKDKRREYEKPWRVEKPEKPGKGKPASSEFLQHVYPGGEGPDAHLIQMLEREVIDRNPNISFDDIAALEDAKDIIQESVLLPLMLPSYFVGIRKPRKGVLLFGPPGTGKTMLAKAVASRGKTTFFNVHSSSLASKWKGDSEKMVRVGANHPSCSSRWPASTPRPPFSSTRSTASPGTAQTASTKPAESTRQLTQGQVGAAGSDRWRGCRVRMQAGRKAEKRHRPRRDEPALGPGPGDHPAARQAHLYRRLTQTSLCPTKQAGSDFSRSCSKTCGSKTTSTGSTWCGTRRSTPATTSRTSAETPR